MELVAHPLANLSFALWPARGVAENCTWGPSLALELSSLINLSKIETEQPLGVGWTEHGC